jgi:hypothetical protein
VATGSPDDRELAKPKWFGVGPRAPTSSTARLDWLDILRLLTMLEILGFHWLRTCQQSGAYGLRWSQEYDDVGTGFGQLGLLFTDPSGLSVSGIINNSIGVAFGYGWEAVNVFVMLSGIGLTLSFDLKEPLLAWYKRRYKRILMPYYGICFPLIVAAEAFKYAGSGQSGVIGKLAEKLTVRNLPDPFAIEIFKHLFLLDPRQPAWIVDLFSPAWWFLPPILFAYLCFPLFVVLLRQCGKGVMLAVTLVLSLASYESTHYGLLPQCGWYFIVCHESFNFTLAIILGLRLRSEEGRQATSRFLRGFWAPVIGFSAFALGNVLSWFSVTHFAASCLFTPGLAVFLGSVSAQLTRLRAPLIAARFLDSYFIYLLHQWIALPLVMIVALVMGVAARSLGFSGGFLLYLAFVFVVVWAFTKGWARTPDYLR